MGWEQFLSWSFQAMIAGGVIYAARCMSQLKESVESLNKQMATVLERDQWHQRWLEKHDVEIESLRYDNSHRG